MFIPTFFGILFIKRLVDPGKSKYRETRSILLATIVTGYTL